MPQKFNNMKKNKKVEKNKEEQRQEIAKVYGLSLADIEHVVLQNGKEFFKFYNPKDRSVKMIENRDYGVNLSQSFKTIQQELSFTQSSDAKENAEEIYNHNLEYKHVELSLVPVTELKGNKYKYIRQINKLSTIDRKRLMALLKSADEIELTHINIENAIGLDMDHQVIDVDYDYKNNHAIIKKARVLSYQDNNEMVNEENIVVEISDADIDLVINEIIVADDLPTITEAKEIMVAGEKVNTKTVIECYNTPEIIDRINLNNKQKTIYKKIINAIKKKIQGVKKENKNQKVKTLTKKDNSNAA